MFIYFISTVNKDKLLLTKHRTDNNNKMWWLFVLMFMASFAISFIVWFVLIYLGYCVYENKTTRSNVSQPLQQNECHQQPDEAFNKKVKYLLTPPIEQEMIDDNSSKSSYSMQKFHFPTATKKVK